MRKILSYADFALTGTRSLYERLDGETGVEGVINHFLASVADDDRLGTGFADIDMDWLRALLIDWLCEAGGPCHTDETGGSQAPARARASQRTRSAS